LLYSNDTKGKSPPDLGTLIKTEDITANVFVCPDSGKQPPPGMTPDQAADWVNHNSDYIYIGIGVGVPGVDPQTVIVYERETNHGRDGMNILFGDGHVKFDNLPAARRLIEKSTKPHDNAQPPENNGGL
jgi:prepilin-type processing-associated H-X9-DG protein